MKQFTTIKVGYTAGIYGNSGEQFITIYTDEKGMHYLHFEGQYGAEERVNSTFKDLGYTQFYTPSVFGRMTRKDIPSKLVVSEYQAIRELKGEEV
jgi:hypothetical protein